MANANAMFPNIVNSKIPIIDLLDDCVGELYKNKNYKVIKNLNSPHNPQAGQEGQLPASPSGHIPQDTSKIPDSL